jgi:hypothetical protein
VEEVTMPLLVHLQDQEDQLVGEQVDIEKEKIQLVHIQLLL